LDLSIFHAPASPNQVGRAVHVSASSRQLTVDKVAVSRQRYSFGFSSLSHYVPGTIMSTLAETNPIYGPFFGVMGAASAIIFSGKHNDDDGNSNYYVVVVIINDTLSLRRRHPGLVHVTRRRRLWRTGWRSIDVARPAPHAFSTKKLGPRAKNSHGRHTHPPPPPTVDTRDLPAMRSAH